MEIMTEIVNNQLELYIIPVAVVFFVAILVFTFGFKSAEQPPFDKLTNEDRKSLNKKRKIKEKKPTVNGHVSTGESKVEKSPSKESKRSPAKEPETQKVKEKKLEKNESTKDKAKKNEVVKARTVEDLKLNKKNAKKLLNEKPKDFDDGDWETVTSKSDKKKKQESPVKKDKKSKKIEKPIDVEKQEKEELSTEVKEQEQEKEPENSLEDVKSEIVKEEPILVIEEKKEKKKEKKSKKQEVPNPTELAIEILKPEGKAEKVDKPKEETTPVAKLSPKEEVDTEVLTPEISTKSGGVVFDELADTWTEAKTAKKSKKKARKDN